LNDVLRIILETMYRAIGFDRVLLSTLDAHQQALRCRFGFGADTEAIVQKGVSVPLDVDRKRTVGLIYADSNSPAALHFSAEELGLLKTLRNQAVLAMRRHS
jgi:hypothetical protein